MTQSICYVEDCEQLHHAQGLCSTHYARQRKRAVKDGNWETVEVDAAPFKKRIQQFLDLGYNYNMLQSLTGIERSTFSRAITKDRQVVLEDNLEKLSRVPLLPLWKLWRQDIGIDYRVPSYLASRRVRALMAMGYTTAKVAEVSGVPQHHLSRLVHKRACESIMRSNLVKIVDAYEQLWDQKPPLPYHHSDMTRYAHWPLPIEWDEDELDHPDSEPKVKYRARRRWEGQNRRDYFRKYQAERRAARRLSEVAGDDRAGAV